MIHQSLDQCHALVAGHILALAADRIPARAHILVHGADHIHGVGHTLGLAADHMIPVHVADHILVLVVDLIRVQGLVAREVTTSPRKRHLQQHLLLLPIQHRSR